MAANIYDAVLFVGDSLTEGGWATGGHVQLFADYFNRRFDVVNRGLAGYNSEWGLSAFKQILATKEVQCHLPTVRLLMIWWGANDSVEPGAKQHIPLDKFAENLHTSISLVTSPTSPYYSPATKIILLTPPPVTGFVERENSRTETYAKAVKEVGEETGTPVCDVWNLFWDAAGRDGLKGLGPFFSDGLHLTAAGYKIVYDGLIDIIESQFPELSRDNNEPVFAHWDTVDPDSVLPRKRS